MSYLATFLATLATCIIVDRFLLGRFSDALATLISNVNKALGTVRSAAISDHWKEKVLIVYAGRIFRSSLQLALLILVLAAVYCASYLIISFPSGKTALLRLSSPGSIDLALMMIAGGAYFLVRKLFRS